MSGSSIACCYRPVQCWLWQSLSLVCHSYCHLQRVMQIACISTFELCVHVYEQDLGLRDYARIDFWVVPDAPVPSFMTEADKNTILELEQEDHLHAWDFMASRDSEDQAVDPPDDLSPEDICRCAPSPCRRDGGRFQHLPHSRGTGRCADARGGARWCRQAGGIITVADVNSCCSLERNSMVFLQAARSGLSHEHVLQHIVARARRRAGLEAQPAPPPSLASSVLLPTPLREVSEQPCASIGMPRRCVGALDCLAIACCCRHSCLTSL